MYDFIRPAGFYDVLRAPQSTANPAKRALRSNAYALRGTAIAPELDHKMPNFRPSPTFFRTKDYVTSNKPAVTASAKGPGAKSGGGGGTGSQATTALKSAFKAVVKPPPVPFRSNDSLGPPPRDRGYSYG